MYLLAQPANTQKIDVYIYSLFLTFLLILYILQAQPAKYTKLQKKTKFRGLWSRRLQSTLNWGDLEECPRLWDEGQRVVPRSGTTRWPESNRRRALWQSAAEPWSFSEAEASSSAKLWQSDRGLWDEGHRAFGPLTFISQSPGHIHYIYVHITLRMLWFCSRLRREQKPHILVFYVHIYVNVCL